MSLRDDGLKIDESLKTEYHNWKNEISRLNKVIEEQNAILSTDEAKGDRSENAVFQNAADTKEKSMSMLRILEERVETFDRMFAAYSTEKYVPESEIKIGSIARLNLLSEHKTFIVKVVPRKAGAPLLGAIQENSPLGRALLGKKEGDTASCMTVRGTFRYIVEEVY